MTSLDRYIDDLLARGRAHFTKEEALKALGQTSAQFLAVAERLVKRHRLARPRLGFYLILRPEDRVAGAPDPARWIDPLAAYLKLPYRISLLRAAAFHGSSHQAAMVFQVIAPKQIRPIKIGRHRIQFLHQAPNAFRKSNQPEWLDRRVRPATLSLPALSSHSSIARVISDKRQASTGRRRSFTISARRPPRAS